MHVREFFRRLFGIGNDMPTRRFEMKPGDRVIHTEADDPRGCIPAMQVMFGTIVESPYRSSEGVVYVKWDCDKRHAPDWMPRSFVRLISPEEEQRRRADFDARLQGDRP